MSNTFNTANMVNIEFEDCKKESAKLRTLFKQLLYVDTVISSLNAGEIDVQCSPHVRDIKIIISLPRIMKVKSLYHIFLKKATNGVCMDIV